MAITAALVKELRERTGSGMMECKKALVETDGDIEAAAELMRKSGAAKADKKAGRVAADGAIKARVADDGKTAVILEVNSETDFVAKNEDFIRMVHDVTGMALAQPAGDVTCTDDMQARIDDLRVTTRENVNFARGIRLDGGSFGQYVHHDGKRACLLQLDGNADDDVLKGICQHIVFHDPMGVSEDDVPAEQLTKIREEAIAEAKESGKNDEIAGKIAEGKVRTYDMGGSASTLDVARAVAEKL